MKNKLIAGILLLASMVFFCSCEDEEEYSIATGNIITTVTTGSADVSSVSATIYGTVLDLSDQASSAYTVGAYYSTSESSVTSGTKATGSIDENGAVTVSLSGLSSGVTYYYCIYVTLQGQVTYYGDVKSFVTTDAGVATAAASSVTAVSAILGGTLTGVSDLLESESESLAYGFLIASTSDGVEDGTEMAVTGTTNSYSLTLEGLVPATTYYFAAYRALDGVYEYGEVQSFTTDDMEFEYVDLGLDVAWASCNVGATTASELGGLYGWGDVYGILRTTSAGDYGTTSDIAETDYDVCTKFGGRTPTQSDINELLNNTTYEWTTVDGVAGYTFTASNGNSIFLPAAGYRDGDTVSGEGELGWYWSGTIDANSTDYAYMLSLDSESAARSAAERYLGLCVRPVKDVSPLYTETGVLFNNRKLLTGDIEGNGNYRLEIYNAYGSGSADDPGLDPSELAFNESISVTFTLSGIPVTGEYQAYLGYAASDWSLSNFSYDASSTASCLINGDGTYTVTLYGSSTSTAVLCIDILGLSTACGDAVGDISATIVSIVLDGGSSDSDGGNVTTVGLPFDNDKLLTGDIESNGNYRLEIYNAYGSGSADDPGLDTSELAFSESVSVTFKISGISVEGEYQTYLAFASSDWSLQNWSYDASSTASCLVTGDGTYTVTLSGSASSVAVMCVDIVGLVSACGSADGISAEIVSIVLDGDDSSSSSSNVTTVGLPFDNDKLLTGDIESNGNYRLEIYNAYGSGSADDPGLTASDVVFSESISVTFKISGISVEGEYQTYMAFADSGWALQNWAYNEDGNGSCIVTGDGTYTVTLSGSGSGLAVFCIDIVGLVSACGSADGISAEVVSIVLDGDDSSDSSSSVTTVGLAFDNDKLLTGDIESNGNYRLEIYNAYGSGSADDPGLTASDVVFSESLAVTFKVSGISVEGEYQTYIAFADSSWALQNWAYNEDGNGSCIVTGDGTYTVTLSGSGSGLAVFCIDIVGLVSACGSADGISAEIVSIVLDGNE